jgi:hypothetical protein
MFVTFSAKNVRETAEFRQSKFFILGSIAGYCSESSICETYYI